MDSRAPLNWRLWLIVGALLIIGVAVLVLVSSTQSSPAAVPYSAFKRQVGTGNVAQITMHGFDVTGAFKAPVAPAAGPAASVATTKPDSAPIRDFRTTIPQVGDPTLLPLLEKENIRVDVQPATSGNNVWATLLSWLFLGVLMVALFMLLSRRSGGQDQIFSFGQSRARRYNNATPGVTFADVAGVTEAKQELAEIVDFLREPGRFNRLGGRMPKGILLAGPPGTGKTLLAKALAGEAHVAFFSLSGSEFVEMLVGVGASRVRDLFKKAKAAAPCIIFVDELDAVGRRRGAGLGGGHEEREQTLNQLLVEMDGFDPRLAVIVMAATNRPDVLDPALLRPGRFDRTVTLDRPDRSGREAILAIHTRKMPLAEDVDLAVRARATPGLVGADLANLVNEAAIIAVQHGAECVGVADFEAATDKILIGPARKLVLDDHERRLVAYHEAGHALLATLLPKADPVHKVSIVPHGQALGVTLQLPLDDRHNYSEDYLRDRMTVMLGGRIAEEIIFGVPSTGAEGDLVTVTRLARQMVARWGMSRTVGRLCFNAGEEHPFLGQGLAGERDFSEATAALIDSEMRRIVDDLYVQAERLLREHRAQLDCLAAALLEHETLDSRQLAALFTAAIPPRPSLQESAGMPGDLVERPVKAVVKPGLA